MSAFKCIILSGFALIQAACSGHGSGHVHDGPSSPSPVAALPAAPAPTAATLHYVSSLNGTGALVATQSGATGEAKVTLNVSSQTMDLEVTVRGITVDQLWDRIVKAPIGPIHFHLYGSTDYANSSSALAVPVPFGSNYRPTADGFVVTLDDFSYAQAQGITGSALDFNGFVSSIDRGLVVMNIHTDAYPDGEIGGVVRLAK
jgi:hypothetical protein